MEYQATAKYIRMGPRKVRLVAKAVSGMQATVAIATLAATPKLAAKPLIKIISSALANAKVKQAQGENLTIASIDVMEGPVLKRWHAASKGMAHPYKKQMSHIKVILTDNKRGDK